MGDRIPVSYNLIGGQRKEKSMKPILFNTEMVRAILDGRKTVTRRVVKPRYRDDEAGFQVITTRTGEFVRIEKVDENECGIFQDGTERHVNPPYRPGDILWVRETWRKTGVLIQPYAYRADEDRLHLVGEDGQRLSVMYRWRPSIHMPGCFFE